MRSRLLLLVLLVAAGCGGRVSAPHARTPTEPDFLAKGSFSSAYSSGTLWVDTRGRRLRYDVGDKVFLVSGGGFTVLYPRQKAFFVYDPRRVAALERAGRTGERSRYYQAALASGGFGLLPGLRELLAHPCERASVRLGAHADCAHMAGPGEVESWSHAVTRRGSLQEGFQKRVTTLSNEYDPRRGLILSESYQSSFGSGSHSFSPDGEAVRPEAFEVPKGYREVLTDSDLVAQALPVVGAADMAAGGAWKMAENYHDDYPPGDPMRQLSMTRERWYRGGFGTPQHEEILIWRLHAWRDLGLHKPGVMKKLDREYRLSSHFVNPEADPPGRAPFPLEENAWALVGPRGGLYVRVVPEKSKLDPLALLRRLAPRAGLEVGLRAGEEPARSKGPR